MKKLILLICTLSFLATAQSSPHNGSTLVHRSENAVQDAQIHNATCIVIPLQAMGVQVLKLQGFTKHDTTLKNVNSTLYYRNFYAYIKNKPVIFAVKTVYLLIFRWV